MYPSKLSLWCNRSLRVLKGIPGSEICEAEGIHPTAFDTLQKTLFGKGMGAFKNERFASRGFGPEQCCVLWILAEVA